MVIPLPAIDREPLQDHCGVLAIFSPTDGQFFLQDLSAHQELQTRGYDGAGFWAIDSTGQEYSYKNAGMIREVFPTRSALVKEFAQISAQTWVFQNRYGTSGDQSADNVQPLRRVHVASGEVFTIAHNGQFSKRKPGDYTDISDTVAFADALANSAQKNWMHRIEYTLKQFRGAYSLIIATGDAIYCARDRFGFRPLVYGRVTAQAPHTWVIASETTSLRNIGATHYTEVMPGSIVKFSSSGVSVLKPQSKRTQRAYCIFENVYLMEQQTLAHMPTAQATHIRNNPSINLIRFRSGQILAEEAPVAKRSVDFVCGVPGTGISGAQGFANVLGLPYLQAIVDAAMPMEEQRTFMEADIEGILQKVANHFSFETEVLRGKRVVLVDDSLVRGNVMSGLIRLLREHCMVKTIHVRILCPPVDKVCYLGINTRSADELLAHQCNGNVSQMKKYIGADSLEFISASGLKEAVTNNPHASGFCMGCMFGQQPPIDIYGKKVSAGT